MWPTGTSTTVQAYRGLARREPVAAAVLAFALACLAGLPPGVVGLVAKLVALRPVVDGELWLLAVIAAANVALGVAYYLRWGALLVSAPAPGVEVPTWRVRPAEGLAVGAGAAACLMTVGCCPSWSRGCCRGRCDDRLRASGVPGMAACCGAWERARQPQRCQ